jgi:hypothetical protein
VLDSSEPGCIVLDVQPTMGDAAEFKIAGQVRVLERQCIEFNHGGKYYDVITLPEQVAKNLGKDPDEPPPPEKKRRRR